MKYGRYGKSHLAMSFGLGVTLLIVGVGGIRNPDTWQALLPATLGLSVQAWGIVTLVLGGVFIVRWWKKPAALSAVVLLCAVLISRGIHTHSVYSIGLLGTALALFAWPTHYKKRRTWRLFKKRKKSDLDEE